MIYGLHYCLNIIAEEEGQGAGVLNINLNGPGKICKYLSIDKSWNGIDIVNDENVFISREWKPECLQCTPRIGITKAKDKLWRFVMEK